MFGFGKTQTRLIDIFLVVAIAPVTSQNAYAPTFETDEVINPIVAVVEDGDIRPQQQPQ